MRLLVLPAIITHTRTHSRAHTDTFVQGRIQTHVKMPLLANALRSAFRQPRQTLYRLQLIASEWVCAIVGGTLPGRGKSRGCTHGQAGILCAASVQVKAACGIQEKKGLAVWTVFKLAQALECVCLCFLSFSLSGYTQLLYSSRRAHRCREALLSLPPTHNVRLGFENLLEVTDWVHTLREETSYSHYPVIAVMMNSFSNYSLGSCLILGLTRAHTHTLTQSGGVKRVFPDLFSLLLISA